MRGWSGETEIVGMRTSQNKGGSTETSATNDGDPREGK